jgi:hypothetical protein
MPNDDLEQDRLDLSHGLMTKAIGDKLFLAPVNTDKLQRVLDIGTGTGICRGPTPSLRCLWGGR